MTRLLDDDPTIAALRRGDPSRGISAGEESLHRMLQDATSATTAPTPSKKRNTAWIAAIISGALALGIATPALADGVQRLARTGWFGNNPNPPGTDVAPLPDDFVNTEADDSEWIDVTSPDYVDFTAGIFPTEITLPAPYTLESFRIAVAADHQRALLESIEADGVGGGVEQVTGIQGTFETYARCTWMTEWMTADVTGDRARADAAARVLATSATWPATVATDGGGIVDVFTSLAAKAKAGDGTELRYEYKVNCPAIPAGAAQ